MYCYQLNTGLIFKSKSIVLFDANGNSIDDEPIVGEIFNYNGGDKCENQIVKNFSCKSQYVIAHGKKNNL